MKRVKLFISFVLVLCMANVAISDVNAYDTLGYETGEIVGESAPALGFAGAWGGGGGNLNQCTVEAPSLSYTGADSALQNDSGMVQVVVPVFDGGRVGRFLDTDPNGTFADYINTYGTIGKPGQTIYFSFLMKTSHTSPFFAFELKRNDLGDNGALLYVGNDIGDPANTIQVCAFRDRNQDPSNIGVRLNFLGAATTDTELYVIRIDFGETGDNVTVYRNPSLDAEPVMAPHLTNPGFLDFNAISLAAWVDPGGRTAQFDEICIASTYTDVVRFYNKADRAQNVSPTDGAVDVTGTPGVTLSWEAGTGVTPTGYKVYFSDVLDDVLAANDAAYQGTTANTDMAIDTINTDSVYYWSVTEMAEPNDIPGVVWMFETNKTLPIPVTQPVSQQVFEGENVSFTFDVTSETPESYQWYDTTGMLSDSGNISGTQTATLTITGAQIANQGDFYCEVTNNAGTIGSSTVNLLIKRLVGHWSLDEPTSTDPNLAWQDLSSSGNDLQAVYTVPETFTWAEGADGTANGALVYDGFFALGTKKEDGTMNDIPIGDSSYTISAWINPVEPYNRGIMGWGNFGTNLEVNAVKIDHPYWIHNYWWDADLHATRDINMEDGSWHLVTVTYDRTTRVIYIDGLAANQDTPPNHAVPSSVNFLLGKTNTLWDGEFFKGAIDDARVYNYALTALDIAQMYAAVTDSDVCLIPPAFDVSGDCIVNLDDIALLATEWLDCGLVPSCVN